MNKLDEEILKLLNESVQGKFVDFNKLRDAINAGHLVKIRADELQKGDYFVLWESRLDDKSIYSQAFYPFDEAWAGCVDEILKSGKVNDAQTYIEIKGIAVETAPLNGGNPEHILCISRDLKYPKMNQHKTKGHPWNFYDPVYKIATPNFDLSQLLTTDQKSHIKVTLDNDSTYLFYANVVDSNIPNESDIEIDYLICPILKYKGKEIDRSRVAMPKDTDLSKCKIEINT